MSKKYKSNTTKFMFDEIEKMYPDSKDNGFFKAISIYPSLTDQNITFGEFKIYHYTDVNALINIIQSQGLWLSNAKYLNDEDEIINGINISTDLIKRLLKKNKYNKDKYKEILEELLLFLEKKVVKDSFICSFSLKADDLDQWRAYGRNGSGVCIELKKARENYTLFEIGNFFQWYKVLYDDAKKYQLIHSIIFKFLYYAKSSFINEKFTVIDYVSELHSKITYLFTFFKNKTFESENEIRLVYTPKNIEELKKDFQQLHFRESNNMVIPFIRTNEHKLKLNDKKDQLLPISKIIVGPTSNKKATTESIRELLNYYQYENIDIEESRVPFR